MNERRRNAYRNNGLLLTHIAGRTRLTAVTVMLPMPEHPHHADEHFPWGSFGMLASHRECPIPVVLEDGSEYRRLVSWRYDGD